jgi:hypothetical protein
VDNVTSVTTTTILGRTVGRDLFRLTPTSWEIAAPLIAFAIVLTVAGLIMMRRRRR